MKIGKETRKVEVVTYTDEDVYVLELNRDELEIVAHALLLIGDGRSVKEVTGVDLEDLTEPLKTMINSRWRHQRSPSETKRSILALR